MNEQIVLSDAPYGYERTDELEREFVESAERLRVLDGWANPAKNGERELRADLALEGGGVKGVGLVGAVLVLSEAGYTFPRVAGTSAGAITASLVASISQTGRDMTLLNEFWRTLDFQQFMPEGRLHELVGHAAGHAASHAAKLVTDLAILTKREGIYSGDYLEEWLRPILHEQLGIRTFGDLTITSDFDPDLSVSAGQRYRLVVYASDLTRSRLARLPWDFNTYGFDPDTQDPVTAVRASMSVPFYFEPVHLEAREATVEVHGPGGTTTMVTFPAGTHTLVDGGLLTKFPIHSFDRADNLAPRWPTIGVKLSQFRADYPATTVRESAIAIALRCLKTIMNEWDTISTHENTVDRTIFVDNGGLSAMDFDLTKEQQDQLFLNGVRAATTFIIDAARQGGIPRR